MDEKLIDKEREGLPGCSELHRVMACPGYLAAKDKFPRSKPIERPESKSGSEIHEALEMMEYVIDGNPVEIKVTDTQQWIIDRCAEIVARITADVFGGEKPQKLLVEERMFMTADGKKLLAGKPDKCAANQSWNWLIVDYKTGPKPYPPATHSWQIHGQALCLESHISTRPDIELGGEIMGAIIQPLVSMYPQIVKVTPDAARAVKRQVIDALTRSKQPGQPRIPGEHCGYCPVVASCPEAQCTGVIIQKKFSDVSSLSPAQLVELHKLLPQIEARCEEVRNHLKQLLFADPNAIPGLVLVMQNNGFEVEDNFALAKALDPVISKAELSKMLKAPVTQLRNLWVDRIAKANDCTKKSAEEAWDDQIGPVLVPRPQKMLVKQAPASS